MQSPPVVDRCRSSSTTDGATKVERSVVEKKKEEGKHRHCFGERDGECSRGCLVSGSGEGLYCCEGLKMAVCSSHATFVQRQEVRSWSPNKD